jgi:Zn-dependent protease with chaperone function
MTMPHALAVLLEVFADLAPVGAATVLGLLLRQARRRERAADAAGAMLLDELRKVREVAAERGALLAHLELANYRLACQLHGKAAVDKAIRDAHDRGTN